MVDFTRRALFKVSAGVAAGMLADSLFSRLPIHLPIQSLAGFAGLRERWVDIVTGRTKVIPTDSRFSTALLGLDARVSAWQALLDGTVASVLTDLDVTGPNPDVYGGRRHGAHPGGPARVTASRRRLSICAAMSSPAIARRSPRRIRMPRPMRSSPPSLRCAQRSRSPDCAA